MTPLQLVATGALLLVGSWLVVFLMVLRQLAPSFELALAAYGASVVGLGLGVAGAALWTKSRHRR